MNEQEIFDTVVRHLGKQGKRSISFIGCAYRTTDGLKCAAGCLIPDELYDPEMEETTVSLTLFKRFPKLVEELPWFEKNWVMIYKLQQAHDISWSGGIGSLINELYSISYIYRLDPAVITEAFPESFTGMKKIVQDLSARGL